MSDQPDAGSLPELTPEQESTVRRLLAEARHDQPVPAEVAARLDGVLADLSHEDLVEEPSAGDTAAPVVVDLAARRRRRNAGRLLVAAAAVIVAGVGVGQVLGSGSQDADDAGTAASEAPERATRDQDGSAAGADSAPVPEATLAGALPLQLRSASLEQDVRVQLSDPAYAASLGQAPTEDNQDLLEETPAFRCPSAEYGAGELFPAYYDGIPTVLALRPGTGETREAELLECGTGAQIRAFTVRLP